jgi:nitrilase
MNNTTAGTNTVSTSKLNVAAIQMVSGDDIATNLARADELIASAAEKGARLVVLPENFAAFGGGKQRTLGAQERTPDGPVRQFLAQQARRHRIWIVGGSVPIADSPDSNRVFSACLVFNPQGEQVARYNKMHLFDVDVDDKQGSYRESAHFYPGEAPARVEIDGVQVGLAICYDLRFPELFRKLWVDGVQLFVLPSAFTFVTGAAHWESLIRARAIENLCYFVAPNQGGQHNAQRYTWGHSMIVSPWGDILASAEQGEAVVVAEVDFEQQNQQRKQLPVHTHRRL